MTNGLWRQLLWQKLWWTFLQSAGQLHALSSYLGKGEMLPNRDGNKFVHKNKLFVHMENVWDLLFWLMGPTLCFSIVSTSTGTL
jgi:hypothetical protein